MLQFRRLIQPIFQELHPHRFFPSLTVGLVVGGLEIIFAISLSALIFSGDLSESLPTGIGIALFSVLMLNVILAWMSSLPGVVVNVQESSAALIAVVAHSISMNMPASASATEKLLTVVVAIALISIVTGIFFFALGWFKLGNLIRFVPYPVVGGFLAGTSINQANSYGLLIGSLPVGNLWRPFSFWELSQVHWLVIFAQVGNLFTIPLVCIVTLLLNATGIEVVVEQDIDLNRELQAAGIANIAAGCGGGIIGFQGLALSALSHKVGTNSRLVGFFMSVIAAIALLAGGSVLSYLPKMLLGGLLLFLGISDRLAKIYHWLTG
jgi:MFS superfamily sulfate permease-like transporter